MVTLKRLASGTLALLIWTSISGCGGGQHDAQPPANETIANGPPSSSGTVGAPGAPASGAPGAPPGGGVGAPP